MHSLLFLVLRDDLATANDLFLLHFGFQPLSNAPLRLPLPLHLSLPLSLSLSLNHLHTLNRHLLLPEGHFANILDHSQPVPPRLNTFHPHLHCLTQCPLFL